MSPAVRRVAGISMMAVGVVLAGYGAYIPAKAALAQVLLERSWAASTAARGAPAPWPWADTHPVARLSVPRLKEAAIVLAGAHGRALPFGPGHVTGTALPGQAGHSVVAAHRDTHFAFLKNIRPGDDILVEVPGGARIPHAVVEAQVLDVRKGPIAVDHGNDMLTLVTCYPFENWDPGGPLRYVVTAVAVPGGV